MNTPTDITQELIAMAVADQKMRACGKDAPQDYELDRRNLARLKEIVATIGWPTISKVGREASNAAWLIAQHGHPVDDLGFMKQCLAAMQGAKDDVALENIAFLDDRLRTYVGRPQLYGTQYQWRQADNQMHLHPIEDPDHLDERRKDMGMCPFKETDAAFRRREH